MLRPVYVVAVPDDGKLAEFGGDPGLRYPVNQLFGIQSNLPDFMMNTHPMKKPKDAANYVKRISRFGVAFDQVIEGLDLRERDGIVPPRFVLDEVLTQMRSFVQPPPRENPLFTTFEKKLQELIAGSKFEKKVVEIKDDDFTKSFHR